MISFKGILKYLIYAFIAGWMFLLGIMVGRGNSPVRFDTQKFQKRLETIALEFGEKKGVQKKVDLTFYDVLDHPVPVESVIPEKKSLEILPRKEMVRKGDRPSVKTSRKKQTFHRKIQVHPETPVEKKASPQPNTLVKKKAQNPRYTVQIAAYKEFKDAVTQMAILEKKKIASYRVKGEKDGVTWYRVRSGSFVTYEEAKKFKEKLDKAGINSMIIKRDRHEDIKG